MSVVDEIKLQLDIVEFVGEYVPLQKAGRNYKALCPFHTEKTPSFIVFPDSQNWHCFGACATGGDVFGFVMRRENLDFAGALRFLADKAGIQLTPLDDEELRQKDELERHRALNALVAQYYHHLLLETPRGEAALGYLERRGVTRETMGRFQLGYAPDDWHALDSHLRREKVSSEEALAAGVLSQSDSGSVYDRFRNRITFPIRDVRGHVIGFGGRVLDDSVPKYLNTPQTPLFDKGSVLYGIDLARATIQETGTAIIVEGYMDVIIPHQCGVTNVVACMGTALSDAQIEMLRRMTKKLVFALDPDAAGMHAVERGIEAARQSLDRRVVPVLTGTGLVRYEERLDAEIRILMLPDGLDPDELILRDRPRWDSLINEALPVGEFYFRQVAAEVDVTTARGKREAADRLLPLIAAMDSPVERTHHLQRLARLIHLDERQILPQLERLRGSPVRERGRGSTPTEAPRGAQGSSAARLPTDATTLPLDLEQRCLALLLRNPQHLPQIRNEVCLSAEAFRDIRNRETFQMLAAMLDGDESVDPELLLVRLDSELRAHVESLVQRLQLGPPLSPDMVRDDLIKSASRLQKNHLSGLIGELQFLQRDAQEQGSDERLRELNSLIEQYRRDYLQIDQQYHAATLVSKSKRDAYL